MLGRRNVVATVAVRDTAVAEQFYGGKLGLRRLGSEGEVPLSIGGTLSAPAISMPAPEALASTIARSAAREGVRVLEEELEERGEEGLREIPDSDHGQSRVTERMRSVLSTFASFV